VRCFVIAIALAATVGVAGCGSEAKSAPAKHVHHKYPNKPAGY
jgi:hypothetical protein